MRILHINLERGWRGGERQTLFLMQGLRNLGHRSVLAARSSNEEFVTRVQEDDFPLIPLKKPFYFRNRHLLGFDIIHAHETRGLQQAVLWKPFHRTPIVYTRRVDNRPGSHIIDRFKYSSVDRLVPISWKISEVMSMWGFDPSRMRVIHSAIPLNQEMDPDKVRMLKQRFPSGKIIGCIASLEKRKDHGTLLAAAAVLQQKRNDVTFVLVGDGDLRKELETTAGMLDLRNTVFEGFRPDPYPYFGLFDVFVMTSKEEGLGSSILDAFRYRVPVVATAAGGIPEIVKNRETGLLVPVGKPDLVAAGIVEMLEDEALRRHCIGNAYNLLKDEYTVETMARSYEKVYREVSGTGIHK